MLSSTSRVVLESSTLEIEFVGKRDEYWRGSHISSQLTQVFSNRSIASVEARFSFPLPVNAVVHSFQAKLGDKFLKSEIKDLTEATAEYDDSISKGNTTVLVEQSANNSKNDFTINLGNFLPGQVAVTKIQWTEPLVTFTIDKTVSYSYKFSSLTSMPVTGVLNIPRIFLRNFLEKDLKSVPSNVEAVSSDKEGTYFRVKDTTNTQFRLEFQVEDSLPTFDVYVEEDSTAPPEHRYAARLSINSKIPRNFDPFENIKEESLEFIFIIDCSGSMYGIRIEEARKALSLFLQSVPYGSYINILRFGDNVQAFKTSSVQIDRSTLAEAKKYTSETKADLGGTNLSPALQLVSSTSSNRNRCVWVLTDGDVTDIDSAIKLIEQLDDNTRVFAMGIGNAVNVGHVKAIANSGRGTFEFAAEMQGRLNTKILNQLKIALMPLMSEISVEIVGDAKIVPCYTKLDSIVCGSKLQSYLFFDKMPTNSTFKLNAKVGGDPISYTVSINKVEKGSEVHRLAASALMNIYQSKDLGNEENKKAVIKLSVDYQILSKVTSYLVSEENPGNTTFESMTFVNELEQDLTKYRTEYEQLKINALAKEEKERKEREYDILENDGKLNPQINQLLKSLAQSPLFTPSSSSTTYSKDQCLQLLETPTDISTTIECISQLSKLDHEWHTLVNNRKIFENSVNFVKSNLQSGESRELYKIAGEQETLGYVKNAQKIREVLREVLVNKDSRWISHKIIEVCKEVLSRASYSEEKQFFISTMAREYSDLALQSTGTERQNYTKTAEKLFTDGHQFCKTELPPTHPMVLEFENRRAAFYSDVMNDTDMAIRITKEAFDNSIAELDCLDEDSYKEATLVLQGMRDNLTLATMNESDECDDFPSSSSSSSSSANTWNNSKPAETLAPLSKELEQLSEVLNQILLLQEADGSWSLNTVLFSLLNIAQEKIEESAANKDLTNWITAIVIAILELKYFELEEDYYLIIEKSKRYIKKKNAESYLEQAKEFVKKTLA